MSLSPKLQARLEQILQSPTYKLAFQDLDLLREEDLRHLRLHLELLKPKKALQEQYVNSTVVVFGSARIEDSYNARHKLKDLQAKITANPQDNSLQEQLPLARRRVQQARYYELAQNFAKLISTRFQQQGRCDFVVVTGGGPGIMAAANRGAYEVGARSIGLNITLPHEQAPNPYITPELAFRFHYFASRKIHFLLQARALVVFPGGYGTMDELFEVLTLIQTGKMPRIPVVLVGREFWQRVFDFEYLVEEGYIAANDAKLFALADEAEEIIHLLEDFYA